MKKKLTFEDVPTAIQDIAEEVTLLRQELSELSTKCNSLCEYSKFRMKDNREILTTKQVSDLVNCGIFTVYRWVHESSMPCFRVGRSLYFYRDEVLSWVEDRRMYV